MIKYQKRLSESLLDRIDIHIEMPRVDYQKLSSEKLGEASEVIRQRISETIQPLHLAEALQYRPKLLISG